MTVYYSLTDLATRVGRDLGIIAAEEVPSGADSDWLSETCSTEIAMLGGIGLPIWNGSDMAVPPVYFTPLSRRIGLAVAVSYGLADPATALMAMREAERYLTLLSNPRRANPLTMRSDDALRRHSGFNFTTGQ